MKKNKIRILSILLTLMLLISSVLTINISAATEPTTYSKEYNSGTRNVVCTTLNGTSAGNYYKNYAFSDLSQKSSSELFTSLQTLMTNTHSYTASYDDCHYKADRTDCTNGSGNVSLIYTSYSATMDQWNGWNREHVWPQSLGGNNTKGGGADLHHVRPADSGVNSSRGNKKYGESGTNPQTKTGSDPAEGYIGGTYNGTYFEPLDNVKGDVARICLYVYVRWNSGWGANDITKVFQSVDILLEWCELDPVDTWEMGRNEVVQDIQGNRNVFIDYPEYAWLLFGKEIPNDMTTPSGEAKNYTASQGSASGNQSGTTTTPEGGNQNETTATSTGDNKNETTKPSTSDAQSNNTASGDCEHSFGDWVDIGKTGGRSRTCSKCGTMEFSSKSNTDDSNEGCGATIGTASVFIAIVPMLGAVCIKKKKRK